MDKSGRKAIMAEFILSAFSDEYSQVFDEQIRGLIENEVKFMEIRGVDGKNISNVTAQEAKILRDKLDANGLGVSSIGSPIGKVKLGDPFPVHLDKLKQVIELAHILGAENIRMFSFYIPADKTHAECRGEVFEKLGKMLDAAKSEGVLLCHENEREIYGDTAQNCLDIQKYFGGEIKCVFDHANFICCDDEPYPYAYEMLRDYIHYMHIKDATAKKQMAPAGEGIGRIPETLEDLRSVDKKFFLTVEPHLQVFKGIGDLQKQEGDGTVVNQYASSAEAFGAAVRAIKKYI